VLNLLVVITSDRGGQVTPTAATQSLRHLSSLHKGHMQILDSVSRCQFSSALHSLQRALLLGICSMCMVLRRKRL
jgi:hypothetical protein